MNRKLISRFLTLGMLLGVLTFGMNTVFASRASDLNDCLNACEQTYDNCGFKIGKIVFQPPWCGINWARCNSVCIDTYGSEIPIVVTP